MPLLPRLRLVAALLLAVLQVARVGGEWLEDARIDGGQPIVVHVEQQGGSDHCPPAHALDCAICAQLATPVLPASPMADLLGVFERAAVARSAEVPLAGTVDGHPYRSRAPPLA